MSTAKDLVSAGFDTMHGRYAEWADRDTSRRQLYLLRAARTQPKAVPWALTEREREILRLLASGETDHDIAAQLYISIRTVRSHLERVRDKTGRRRRPDLTRLAMEQGLIGRKPPPETR